MPNPIEPSIAETAFSCPHCGAFTSQHWYKLRCDEITGEKPTPLIPDTKHKERVERDREIPPEAKKDLLEWFDKMSSGLVFFESTSSEYLDLSVHNLYLSKCYNCEKIAVWFMRD